MADFYHQDSVEELTHLEEDGDRRTLYAAALGSLTFLGLVAAAVINGHEHNEHVIYVITMSATGAVASLFGALRSELQRLSITDDLNISPFDQPPDVGGNLELS